MFLLPVASLVRALLCRVRAQQGSQDAIGLRASPLHLEVGSQGRVLPRASLRGGQGIWKESRRVCSRQPQCTQWPLLPEPGRVQCEEASRLRPAFIHEHIHSFANALTYSFSSTHIHSPINLLTHSHIQFPIQFSLFIHLFHSFTYGVMPPFIHFSIHPFSHSFVHPLVHSFIYLLIHLFIHPLLHPFTYLPLLPFILPPSHPPFVRSSIHYLSMHLPTHSLTNTKRHELQTLQRHQPPPAYKRNPQCLRKTQGKLHEDKDDKLKEEGSG